MQHGLSETLLATLQTAIRYAREQEVIKCDLDAADHFADFNRYVGSP
ncbi:hypothetical protein ACIHCV_18955 [Streptomyces sp. NPDC051956]